MQFIIIKKQEEQSIQYNNFIYVARYYKHFAWIVRYTKCNNAKLKLTFVDC